MEKYSDILQFSRDLYVHYTEIPIPQKDREALKPPRFIQSAESALGFFCDAFCTRFIKMFNNHIFQVQGTDEQFFRYVIPRCLKLVHDEEYYFSFMLVAAFIGELSYYLEYERNCYRFSGVAYKCLAAVFKRILEEKFEQKGGWLGLRAYCDNVNRIVRSQKEMKPLHNVLTDFNRAYRRRVFDLIKQCDVLEEECFALNAYELSLIAVDEILEVEAQLNKLTTCANDSPLQVEWTLVKDNETMKVSSTFDTGKGTVSSTCIREGAMSVFEPSLVREGASSVFEPSLVLEEASSVFEPSLVLEEASSVFEPSLVLEEARSNDAILEVRDENSDSDSDENFDSDSDDDSESSSGSEIPAIDDILNMGFGNHVTYLLQPLDYDQKLSAHMCKWCDKQCFQVAKYFFIKHRDASLKPKKLRKMKFMLNKSLKKLRICLQGI